MPTVAQRINITVDRDEDEALLRIAEKSEANTDRLYSMEEAWGKVNAV